eukprot:8479989-Lingulodinium_polyedra.AAC.1
MAPGVGRAAPASGQGSASLGSVASNAGVGVPAVPGAAAGVPGWPPAVATEGVLADVEPPVAAVGVAVAGGAAVAGSVAVAEGVAVAEDVPVAENVAVGG